MRSQHLRSMSTTPFGFLPILGNTPFLANRDIYLNFAQSLLQQKVYETLSAHSASTSDLLCPVQYLSVDRHQTAMAQLTGNLKVCLFCLIPVICQAMCIPKLPHFLVALELGD